MSAHPPQPTHLRIFLSSPGDVAAERSIARMIVDQLQYDPLVRGQATLEVVAWDQAGAGAPLLATETPQASINRGMPRPGECDIVVVILWSRLGTPLPFPDYRKPDGGPYLSGTEWEYHDAIAAADDGGRPAVLVYRRTTKVLLDAETADVDELLNQKRLVNAFFEQMHDRGTGAILRGYKSYDSPDGFRNELVHDLKTVVQRALTGEAGQPAAPSSPAAGAPRWQGSPFPGLRAFTPHDAPIYFGRGRETDALAERVASSSFVAVVGASGSGKSSLVGAGLIPRLQVDADWNLPHFDTGARRWLGLRLTPGEVGDSPFDSLADKLAPMRGTEAAALARELAAQPAVIGEWLPGGRSLMFIDQFEELFTMVDKAHIDGWIELLDAAAAGGRCHVVITLRADFYHRCLALPRLARLLEAGHFPLAAPTDTLHDMIALPAERADLRFAEGLPGRVLIDTADNPDALPLLAYTLDELYRTCGADRQLTHASYDQLGGVQGAIGTRAEHVFTTMLDGQARARFSTVFHHLVAIGERGWATRRRARAVSVAADAPARRFVDVLTNARLLVQGRDEADDPVVYVAHEALFRSWPRLARWIDTTRDDLILEEKVRAAAAEWDANARAEAFLWPHERLTPVYEMLTRLPATLDPVTVEFIRPEHTRLIRTLRAHATEAHRRQSIVDRLVTIADPAIPDLVALLGDPGDGTRAAAATVLARIGARSVPALTAALGSDQPAVRLAAVGALRQIGDAATAADLAPLVHDADSAVRSTVVGALSALGGPVALAALAGAVGSAPTDARWQAAGALGTFGPDAVPHLLDAAGPDTDEGAQAHRALLAIGEHGLQPLLEALHGGERTRRVNAASVLAQLGAPALTGVTAALSAADPGVRWYACDILAVIGGHAAVPDLTRALTDGDAHVRAAAAGALGRLRAAEGVESLMDALGDEDEAVAWAVVDALAALGSTAVPALLSSLAAGGPRVRMASAALSRCAGPDLVVALSSPQAWIRRRCAEAVAASGPAALPALWELFDQAETITRDAAGLALVGMGGPAVPGLVDRLGADDPAVRWAAARALGRLAAAHDDRSGIVGRGGPWVAAARLERMLGDSDPRCAAAAAEALGRFGIHGLPAVWRALTAATATVRAQGARIATSIGAPAVAGLLDVAADKASPGRQDAIDTLRRIANPAALFGLRRLGVAVD
ncbi:nSTAND1 domain-containing NTPase [Catellatospora tritici]|uniref:nSTAND1 domain-containing NTPase n=1 Tax=Catellatospora tritici TaxID=2851566 RepID=UPI001C2DEC6C|nr:HEAT repeat domain-containing protein [Catellatospora tritici]MBV1856621.1 HEAT repeat domain-containing protein [Catellatospora tritici]